MKHIYLAEFFSSDVHKVRIHNHGDIDSVSDDIEINNTKIEDHSDLRQLIEEIKCRTDKCKCIGLSNDKKIYPKEVSNEEYAILYNSGAKKLK